MKEFEDKEQQLEHVLETIGKTFILQRDVLPNTKKMCADKALNNNCDMYWKVLKCDSETSVLKHNKNVHLIKGTHIFKCVSCNDIFWD